ncbi:MAG: RcpC/CpaB family pilus assembly protein [Anaerolineae bacterium]
MRRGRSLLVVGLVILLGVLAVGVYMLMSQGGLPGGETAGPVPGQEESEATVRPADTEPIVVAAQNIPRGMRLTEDRVKEGALAVGEWSRDAVPDGAVRNLESTYGRIARVDIARGMPVLENMLTELPGEFGASGSDAALHIPENKVAYAMPIARYSSVAWALQPGDHVDVILSLLMIDLDEEFQSVLPNEYTCVSPAEGEECQSGRMGRLESLPNGWIVNMTPSGDQRPRLVTQLTIQNATVLQVGDWSADMAPTPAPPPQGEEGGGEEATVAPTPAPPVRPVTLAVSPQDAIALDYAQAVGARINFVLRRAGDEGTSTTESVTLRYLMERYNIELPPKLPHGVTPPLSELERIPHSESAGQYGSSGDTSGGTVGGE